MTIALLCCGIISLAAYTGYTVECVEMRKRLNIALLAPAIIFFFLAACGDSGRAWFWHVATGGWMW